MDDLGVPLFQETSKWENHLSMNGETCNCHVRLPEGPWLLTTTYHYIFWCHGNYYNAPHTFQKSNTLQTLLYFLWITTNVGKTIINHPTITIFKGGITHSQMGGLWHCFSHINHSTNHHIIPNKPYMILYNPINHPIIPICGIKHHIIPFFFRHLPLKFYLTWSALHRSAHGSRGDAHCEEIRCGGENPFLGTRDIFQWFSAHMHGRSSW